MSKWWVQRCLRGWSVKGLGARVSGFGLGDMHSSSGGPRGRRAQALRQTEKQFSPFSGVRQYALLFSFSLLLLLLVVVVVVVFERWDGGA